MNDEERSAAIFGLFDGVVSLVGLVFGLLVAHASKHTIRLTGVGAAVSATVSMATGSFESTKGATRSRLLAATAMGVSTFVGSLLPIVSFFWLGRGPALVVSGLLCLAAAGWVGFEKRKAIEGPGTLLRWYSGYASSFVFLLGAVGITLAVVSAMGGGG